MRVLIAVDSFKGTMTSADAAQAVRSGWLRERPGDTVEWIPLADGGEGTADAIAAAVPGSVRHRVAGVCGPDGSAVTGEWVELPDRIAVVDLAQMSGLPLMSSLDPLGATTRGLGETIRDALAAGMEQVWIGLGGSASTDGGLGALRSLGVAAFDEHGRAVAEGARGLLDIHKVSLDRVIPVPRGVTLLTDVTSPLLGVDGSAAVFGPQKGADPADVAAMEAGLNTFARHLSGSIDLPGSGAAGGAAYGFAAVYRAEITSGFDMIARLAGLSEKIEAADVVITGEGSFDDQSLHGKLTGHVIQRAGHAGVRCMVVAGRIEGDPGVPNIELVSLAGDVRFAMETPLRWAEEAGRYLATDPSLIA